MASPTTARSRLCFDRVVVRFFRCASWHTRCRFLAADSSARAYSVAPHPRADRRSRGARHVDARGHARACVPRPRRAARAPAKSRRASAHRGPAAPISGRLRGRPSSASRVLRGHGRLVPRDRRGWFHRVAPVRAPALQRRRGRRRGQPRRARPLPCALQRGQPRGASRVRGDARRLRRVAPVRPRRRLRRDRRARAVPPGDGRRSSGRTSSGRRLKTHQTHHPRLPPQRAIRRRGVFRRRRRRRERASGRRDGREAPEVDARDVVADHGRGERRRARARGGRARDPGGAVAREARGVSVRDVRDGVRERFRAHVDRVRARAEAVAAVRRRPGRGDAEVVRR